MHTSIVKLTLPDHRILYTGLVKTEANKVAREARNAGFGVITSAKPVTGSNGRIQHYTIIAVPA